MLLRELRDVVLIGHDDDVAVVVDLLRDIEVRRRSLQNEVVEVTKQCLEGLGDVIVKDDLNLLCFLQSHVQY